MHQRRRTEPGHKALHAGSVLFVHLAPQLVLPRMVAMRWAESPSLPKCFLDWPRPLRSLADEILGVGNGKGSLEGPSLKLVKRLKKIEQLPLGKQKALLTNIDMFLKGAESR